MSVNTKELGRLILNGFQSAVSRPPHEQWSRVVDAVFDHVAANGIFDVLQPVSSLTASTTLNTSSSIYMVNPPGVAVNITLPSTPQEQQRVTVKNVDGAGGSAVTVLGNGNTIDGAASTTLDAVTYESVTLVFFSGSWHKI